VSKFPDSTEARFAVEAVREASLLARRVQQEMVGGALAKDDKSPVTVADFAAQALVARRLAERFSGAALMGEESAVALRSEEGRATLEQVVGFVRTCIPGAAGGEVCDWIDQGVAERRATTWTLDPVDGTKGFLRRQQYAVALALIVDGRVQVGALGCPALKPSGGWLLVAERGRGAWGQSLEGADAPWHQLHASPEADIARARLLRSVESGHTDTGAIEQLTRALGIVADPVPMDSQAKYAMLAGGEGEVMVRLLSPSRPDYREMVWDQAAGSIIVEEAGGRVTDLDGKALDFSQGRTLAANRGVLATNGRLHEAILSGLRAIKA
jgi:3'(2'), 5'-bisphosphate nucleotidase